MRKRFGNRVLDTEKSILLARSSDPDSGSCVELYRNSRGVLFFCSMTPAGNNLSQATDEVARQWLTANRHPASLLESDTMSDGASITIELSTKALGRLDAFPCSRPKAVAQLIEEYL